MNKGLIFDIRRFSVNDGPGIRTMVFFKGCLLNCHWCHNPESRQPDIETAKKTIRLDGQTYCETVGIGEWMSVERVMNDLLKDRVFYTTSGGGVTFSGGEPLLQPDFLCDLLQRCREERLPTAIDTSGYCPREILAAVAPLTDLFLYDLKLMDDEEHQRFTGVSNKTILDNLRFLLEEKFPVHIRIPVIPGITGHDANIAAMIRFLAPYRGVIRQIDLLPYHTIGRSKYHRLGKKEQVPGLMPVPLAQIERLEQAFRVLTVLT